MNKYITGLADLTLNGLLSVDNGGLYSSDGTLTFGGGLTLGTAGAA